MEAGSSAWELGGSPALGVSALACLAAIPAVHSVYALGPPALSRIYNVLVFFGPF